MTKKALGHADVVICGAGMAGISTAYFLTKMGVRDVVLVDKLPPLSLTSDKSAETYRNWSPDESMFRFATRSTEIMEQLARETDNVFNLNRRGECYIAISANRASEFEGMVQEYAHRGLGPVRVHKGNAGDSPSYVPPAFTGFEGAPPGSDLLLDPARLSEFYPYLSDEVTAVLHARDCGWFSAHTLGMYLAEQAVARGMRRLRGEVVAVEQDKQGVCAVRIAGENGAEEIKTRRFVNAAGPFVKHIASLLRIDIPVRTGLWEKIMLEDHLEVVPRTAPTLILLDQLYLEWSEEERELLSEDEEHRWLLHKFSSGPYMRPEGGEGSQWLLMGWAYNEPPFKVHRERDADRVGAGAVCEPQWEPRFSAEFPEIVLRGAARMVPGLKQYLGRMPQPVHDGGYYVETKDVSGEEFREDNPPLIGPLGVEGAFIVNSCHGVSTGCAAGELCAAWVTGGERPDYADELSLERYP
jgi:glycine/D-amino acid oxidase-like deaminating enzyme